MGREKEINKHTQYVRASDKNAALRRRSRSDCRWRASIIHMLSGRFYLRKKRRKSGSLPKKESGGGINREIVVVINRHNNAVISISFFSLLSITLFFS